MLPITDETKAAFWANSTTRTSKLVTISIPNLHITIQNDDIKGETMQIVERLENNDNLRFEGCNASMFTCEVTDLAQNITGQYIEVKVRLNNTDIPLFKGVVDEVTNLNHEDMTCKITAYDALYELTNRDVTLWYNSLTFPVTLKYMRDSFFAYCGITQVETSLPNDVQTVTKSITDSVINGGTIIKAICQLNGRFGKINRNGQFQYVKLTPIVEGLYPANDLYPEDDLYPAEENANEIVSRANYINIEYEPYKTARITKVNIYGKDGAKSGTYGINDTNIFNISDNKIAYGLTNANATAQNIYNEIWQIEFIPANIKLLGRPYLETGDSISLVTNKRMVRTYILQRTLNGVQAMTDLFESKSEQYQPEYKQSLATTVSANTTAIKITNDNLNSNVTRLDNRINTTNTNLSNNVTRLDGRIDTTNSNLSSNVTRLDGRIDTTNGNVSSLSSTVSTLSTNLSALSEKAITRDNWSSQTVTDGMISSVSASKLTGTINNARLNQNLGDRTFGTISCNNLGATKIKDRTIAWSVVGGYWVLTGGTPSG